jgi:magnesium and cobalt exporter, CNNM family
MLARRKRSSVSFRPKICPAAGFVLSQLGQLPQIGETFDSQGWRFEVLDLDDRRIDKILATRTAAGRRRAAV